MVNKIFIFILMSIVVFAQVDIKLSKDEFLKKIMDDNLTMKRDPLFPTSDGTKTKLLENFKRLYPTFKNEYWFVPTVRSNKYVYTIFYEWPNRKCIFRVEEIDPNTRQIKPESIDSKGQSIDIKYCEKAYGIKIL